MDADPYYDSRGRVRLWWVDWCRTQSVWNVLCGHAWWTTVDETIFHNTRTPWTALADIGNNGPGAWGSHTDRRWNGEAFFSNVYMNFAGTSPMDGRKKETSNMIEYVVELGALHTIPLFFLLSGYIGARACAAQKRDAFARFLLLWARAQHADAREEAERWVHEGADDGTPRSRRTQHEDGIRFVPMDEYLSLMAQPLDQVGEPGFARFAGRRFMRLIVPWIFGTVLAVLPRAAMRNEITASQIGFNHMYFLYVLFAYGLANYVWCRWLYLVRELLDVRFAHALARIKLNAPAACAGAEERARALLKSLGLLTLGNAVILCALPFTAAHVFHDRPMPHIWPLIVIISFALSALCLFLAQYVAARATSVAHLRAASACITLSVAQFVFVSFALVSPPLFVEPGEYNWLSDNAWVPFLLFELCYMFGFAWSVLEEYVSFWRLTALPANLCGVALMLLSFAWPFATFWAPRSARRIGPWISFYDDAQRHLGMARTWAWIAILIAFAVYFTNAPVSRWLHVHLTQSATIIYIFHRFWEQVAVEMVKSQTRAPDPSIDRFGLFLIIIAFSFACSLGTYAVVQLHWIPRKAFGIDTVRGASTRQKDKAQERIRGGSVEVDLDNASASAGGGEVVSNEVEENAAPDW